MTIPPIKIPIPNPADIAKLLDSKTVQRFYKEAASPAAKQTGTIGEDLMKTFHLFLAPFQLLALGQDRFRAMLDEVRNRVPKDDQIEARAEIAGPVIFNLQFIEDDNIVKDLYLNLLARAIDKNRHLEAHPAYVKVIEQLSPMEGMFLYCQSRLDPFSFGWGPLSDRKWFVDHSAARLSFGFGYDISCSCLPTGIDEVSFLAAHLESLGIIDSQDNLDMGWKFYLTEFGRRFLKAVAPTSNSSGLDEMLDKATEVLIRENPGLTKIIENGGNANDPNSP